VASQSLGNTAKYGVSFIGIAFNGTGFVVVWTNSTYDIVSNEYSTDGTPAYSTPRTIAGTSDDEEWQDVAYSDGDTYYFVWYDHDDGHVHGSFWTADEYVPELNPMVIIILALGVVVVLRRKRR